MKLVLATWLTLCSINMAHAAGTETFYENASGMPLIAMVNDAKTTLDIEIYEMDDPLFLTALTAAVNRGIKIQVVKEERPVGASCRVFAKPLAADPPSCKTQKALVLQIQRAGGKYVPFEKDTLCGISSSCYEHGKIVIADRAQALISTGNFNSSNLCNKKEHPDNCNRDYSVYTRDTKVVSTLSKIFAEDLIGKHYDVSTVLTQSGNQKLTVSPFSLNPLVEFIRSAKTKVQIQNQYLKDPDLNEALIQAAQSGREVEVMVESACAFGKPSASEAVKWQKTFAAFDQAGIKTRIFTRNIKVSGVAGYLHAKAMVLDGNRAWVGSVNGSTTSLSDNREYGIFLNDAGESKKLQNFMNADFASSMGETWQDSVVCKHDPSPSPQQDFQLSSGE